MRTVEELFATGAVLALLYASSCLTAALALFLFSRPGIRLRRSLARGRAIRWDEVRGMALLSALWLPVAFVFGAAAIRCRLTRCC